jgi:hypothetical protein
MKLGAQT